MRENKNNLAFIIISVLIIVGLSGFIVYDKIIKKNDSISTNNHNNEIENDKIDEIPENNHNNEIENDKIDEIPENNHNNEIENDKIDEIPENNYKEENKQEENVEEKNIFVHIRQQYFETQQEGYIKYFITLVNSDEENTGGFFTLHYIEAYGSGSETVNVTGYFYMENDKIIFSNLYSNNPDEYSDKQKIGIWIFDKLKANRSIKPASDTTHYKTYETEYNENELKIGNFNFIRVK